jgi:hypothetical protein
MLDATGPFVHIATFCRDVVEQADGGVTLVGVADRVHVEPDDDDTRRAALTMFISVRAGDLAGKHHIHIRPIAPSGKDAFPTGSFPALFDTGASGVEIEVEIVFEPEEEGLYWFELSLDQEAILTRIPLEISFEPSNESERFFSTP